MNSTSPRYRIGKDGGVELCLAPIRCHRGGPDAHYSSELDAVRSVERETARTNSVQIQSLGAEPLPPHLVESVKNFGGAKMPAGDFFICDPYCLIGPMDQLGWNQYVEAVESSFGWDNAHPVLAARYADLPIVSVKSTHGAGLHWSAQPPRRVPSDTGLIGVVPAATVTALGLDPQDLERAGIGFAHTFAESFMVKLGDNGNVYVGDYIIIVHDDTLPEEAREALQRGAAEGKTYPCDPERDNLRHSTYDRVVSEFLTREI